MIPFWERDSVNSFPKVKRYDPSLITVQRIRNAWAAVEPSTHAMERGVHSHIMHATVVMHMPCDMLTWRLSFIHGTVGWFHDNKHLTYIELPPLVSSMNHPSVIQWLPCPLIVLIYANTLPTSFQNLKHLRTPLGISALSQLLSHYTPRRLFGGEEV
jgi:hypothetical protein